MREALPEVALSIAEPCPSDPLTLFEAKVDRIWLEIGFGGAEHLIWQAQHNPSAGLIGCEVFEEGVVKALTAIEGAGLKNVRLAVLDAREVLRWLPAGSLDRAFILFPDPWPKKRHRKRRLIQRSFLDLLARAMAPGAELRVGTDIADYARSILLAAKDHPQLKWQASGPADWRERGPDWPATRYEGKAAAQGRRCYFFRFLKADDC
jgi:tRNA (guanine-N7-)-methyltransferase